MPPKKSKPAVVQSPPSSSDEAEAEADAEAVTVVRLTPEQKIFLEAYYDDYDAANTKLNRRAIAIKAATELLSHFNITDKGKSSLVRKVCLHFKPLLHAS